MYKDEDMPAPHIGKWAKQFAKGDPEKFNSWYGDFGLAQAKRSKHGYYANISFIDEQIGRILKALEDKGQLDNTLILFISDHGDMMMDHYHWRKSYPYEGSARIPFLMRWPKSIEANAA